MLSKNGHSDVCVCVYIYIYKGYCCRLTSKSVNNHHERKLTLPPSNNDAIWILKSLAWDEVAFSQHYVQSLNKFMPTLMQFVVETLGFWTPQ